MSEACIQNPYDQCFRECRFCVRYQPPNHDCQYCGAEENLYELDDGNYVCEDCLEKAVIDDYVIKNRDAILEFLTEYSDEFHKFLKGWFSEVRVTDV